MNLSIELIYRLMSELFSYTHFQLVPFCQLTFQRNCQLGMKIEEFMPISFTTLSIIFIDDLVCQKSLYLSHSQLMPISFISCSQMTENWTSGFNAIFDYSIFVFERSKNIDFLPLGSNSSLILYLQVRSRAHPTGRALERCSTLVGSGLTCECQTRLERFAREKPLAYLASSSVTKKIMFYNTVNVIKFYSYRSSCQIS